jgi:type VI secretion system protein ImpA
MGSGFALDTELLRNPLPGDHPAGIDLLQDEAGRGLRSGLRDLREEARIIERQADDGEASSGGWPAAVPLWRQLRDKAAAVLTATSRDTSVAAMLIEALARTDGFAGLTSGFDAARALVESSWDRLFPAPDPQDGPADDAAVLEERLMPLVRLAGLDAEGLLVPALLHVPLTSDRGGGTMGLCHWKSSRELSTETDAEKLQLAISRGGVAPATFNASVAETSREFLRENFLAARSAASAWEALCDAVFTATDGKAGLPVTPLRVIFEDCIAAMQAFAPEATAEQPTGEAVAAVGAIPGPAAPDLSGIAVGSPASRDQAFRALEQIALFFESHDPHSLLAAQIRNVVRLGRLPRADYYKEILADTSATATLFKFVGIPTGPEDGAR